MLLILTLLFEADADYLNFLVVYLRLARPTRHAFVRYTDEYLRGI